MSDDTDYLPEDYPDISDSENSGKRYVQQLLTEVASKGASSEDIITSSVYMDNDSRIHWKKRDDTTGSSTISNPVLPYSVFNSKIKTAKDSDKKVFLYLIDLQKDFVDGGAFGVYGGRAMVNEKILPFVKELQEKFGDRLYIRITRDYHPGIGLSSETINPLTKEDLISYKHLGYKHNERGEGWLGHCSFYKEKGGSVDAFPRHCEQGSTGTLLLDVLSKGNGLEILTKEESHPLVMVKGIFPDHDCFAGFPYQTQDDFTKSQLYACTHEHTSTNFKITGGYTIDKLSPEEMIHFNEKITKDIDGLHHVTEEEHLPEIADGDIVIVCGLAGDFCVLNTATNIKKYLKTKDVNAIVYVPQHLTRYPLLPYIALTGRNPLTQDNLKMFGLKPKLMVKIDGNPVGTSIISEEKGDGKLTFKVSDTKEAITIHDPLMDLGWYVSSKPSNVLQHYEISKMLLVDYPIDSTGSAGGVSGSRKQKQRRTKKQKSKRTRKQLRKMNRRTRRH
jgi:nicotinamidase-related amidase